MGVIGCALWRDELYTPLAFPQRDRLLAGNKLDFVLRGERCLLASARQRVGREDVLELVAHDQDVGPRDILRGRMDRSSACRRVEEVIVIGREL
jgi:hypothetical protein